MNQFSLTQVLLFLTFCCVAAATICVPLLSDVQLLVGIGALVTAILVFVKSNNLFVSCSLSLPLVSIVNWSLFVIATGFVFGSSGTIETIVGPFAKVIASPVVFVQNAVSLVRPWDTMTGLFVVSLAEMFGVFLLVKVFSMGSSKGVLVQQPDEG